MFVISSDGKIQKIQPKSSGENYHPTSYKQVMKATQPTDPSNKGGSWIVIIMMALIIIGIIYGIIWALRKYSGKQQQPAFGYNF